MRAKLDLNRLIGTSQKSVEFLRLAAYVEGGLSRVPHADQKGAIPPVFLQSTVPSGVQSMSRGTLMHENRLSKSDDAAIIDLATLQRLAARQRWPAGANQTERSTSCRLALGQETIQLGVVEFRILLYLAGRPYHAFTRRSISDAVSSERDPVAEDMVDQHVASLLKQLGMFHDYVQSVPYVGYRFKA